MSMVKKIKSGLHKAIHYGHGYAHLAYFGGVFIEGHGFYSTMGGVLLFMGIAALFVGGEEV